MDYSVKEITEMIELLYILLRKYRLAVTLPCEENFDFEMEDEK